MKPTSNVRFFLGPTGKVEWEWEPSNPELTLEEARLISEIQSAVRVAEAIEALASAVVELAATVAERKDA